MAGLALPAFTSRNILFIVSHPLWSRIVAPGTLLASVCHKAGHGYREVRLVNTFDLSRRMAWCWQQRETLPKVDLLAAVTPAPGSGNRAKVATIPPDNNFTLATPPRGMPAGKSPSFQRITGAQEISRARKYLVRKQDGECVVGRVDPQTNAIGETVFRVQPVNHLDGVAAFDAARTDIAAELL